VENDFGTSYVKKHNSVCFVFFNLSKEDFGMSYHRKNERDRMGPKTMKRLARGDSGQFKKRGERPKNNGTNKRLKTIVFLDREHWGLYLMAKTNDYF